MNLGSLLWSMDWPQVLKNLCDYLIVASRISLRLQAQSKAIDPSETHFVEMLSCARRRIMAISARPSRFTSSPRPLEQ